MALTSSIDSLTSYTVTDSPDGAARVPWTFQVDRLDIAMFFGSYLIVVTAFTALLVLR